MKIKVTLMTENDIPVEELGDNPELQARKAWEAVIAFLNFYLEANEDIWLDSVEIVEDE